MTRNDVEYLDLGELVVLLTQNMICVFSVLETRPNCTMRPRAIMGLWPLDETLNGGLI